MKSFKSFISENSNGVNKLGGVGVGTTQDQQAVDHNINPSAINNPKVLRSLNAFVGAIANMEYLLPEHALNKLRSSLNRVGFSFGEIPEMTESSGSFDLPLTLFGGRFGKDLDTPHDEIINDDGISHIVEGGLALKIQYEMMKNNSCRIFAKIA
jgi:chromosome condensin MukBEF MukE localization factor